MIVPPSSLSPYKKVLAVAVSLISVQVANVAAQEDEMEEVIVSAELSRYSATKSDTPILETSRSLSVETLQQIIDKGALKLSDTFVYSSGVTGQPYGFATRVDSLFVRGLDVPQYQDSLQSLFGNYNNTRPDIYTLEQVEILKGPASVLYGKGSPGGLLNIVSKRPQDESRHEIAVDYGTFDRKQIAFDSTGRLDDQGQWLYRVVGVYRDGGTQVDEVDEEAVVFAPSITYRPTEDTNISLLLNYQDTKGDTAAQFLPIYGTLEPSPTGETIDDSNYLGDPNFNRYDSTSTAITLLADHQINDSWSVEVTARHTDGEADYQQAWASFGVGTNRYIYNDDGSLYKDGTVPRTFYRSDSTSTQAAIDIRTRVHFSTGAFEHEVLAGIQYQDVETTSAGYYAYAVGYDFVTQGPDQIFGDRYWINVFNPQYGNIPPEELLNSLYADDPDDETEDYGIYINDQISVGNWRITLGLRADETENTVGSNSQKDDAISGSAGVLYQFDNGFAPYINYAESFEPVIGDNGNGQLLDPQEGKQTEVGIKYQPDEFPGLITLAYFDITQTNLPDPSSRPGEFEQQSGEATIKGLELEAQANFGDFTTEFNFSNIETESALGFQLASVPELQASAWLGYRPSINGWQGFKTGVGVRYVGKSFGGLDIIETPSYTLGDFMIGYELDHWDFTLNVRNLTDKEYYASCLARGIASQVIAGRLLAQ